MSDDSCNWWDETVLASVWYGTWSCDETSEDCYCMAVISSGE